MAYLVLARKWRPQTLADLVGQKHIEETLGRAIQSGRVAHAFLFTGTRGIGKTTTARILAMALNCEKGPTPSPCGVCSSCREIRSGSGLDVLEIDGASNNSVEDVRALRENAAYTPAGGKYRIVIIDEVHMLSRSAFNALLKTLEEPPPNFLFIFATTEVNKVPDTILSRVQRYDFKRISPADIAGRLRFICGEEKIECEEGALAFISERAAGSMRDALTLLDQIIPYSNGKITAAGVRSVLGLVDTEIYLALFEQIASRDSAALLRQVADLFSAGYDLVEFASGLEEHVRGLLFGRIKGADALFECPAETRVRYTTQSARFTELDLLRMAELVSRLPDRVSRSPMPRFELETALLKLAHLDRSIDIAQFLARGGADGPGAVASAPAAGEPVRPSRPAPIPPLNPSPAATPGDVSHLQSRWHEVTQAILADNQTLGSFLSYSVVLSATPETLTLGMNETQKFQFSQVTRQENVTWLKNFLLSKYGFSGALTFEMTTQGKSSSAHPATGASPAAPKTTLPLQQKENINDAIRKEPIVGKILDVFDGNVI
ncbi:MAG: DNA polymerase III subunit gamma/tau [Fibrobacterota bacterium]